MTASLPSGYRLFSGEQLNTQIDTAQGAAGPTGPTGPTGSAGATGPTGAGAPVSTPANASATGTAGTWSYDSTHIYVCVATNTWVRASLATW